MKTSKIIILVTTFLFTATLSFAQTKLDDKQIKNNATPITSALSYVNRLEPVTYNYNNQQVQGVKLPQGNQYGFMADNVQSVLPAVVKTESKLVPAGKNAYRSVDVKTVDMQSLIPVLLGAIKEQQQQIEELKAEVQSLKQSRAAAAERE